MAETIWWKGSRGEWYLVVQASLFLLLFFGPRDLPGLPAWNSTWSSIGSSAGAILGITGILLASAGLVSLGRNLTPLPRPKENTTLVTTGPYRLVRHPIYSGLIFMALGWAFWLHSWLTAGYALLLLFFFDIKSRREERWLEEKFPEYTSYRRRTRKLLPFLY